MRLAYVSPLPPVRSGISDYSVDLLRSLQSVALSGPEDPVTRAASSLGVVRVPGQEVRDDLEERLHPMAVGQLEAGVASGELLPWYQMGNNPYHSEIGRLARRLPGVLTLHDIWLHHLLIEETLAQGDVAGYVDRLTEEHGWIGGAVALPPRWSGYSQAAMFALPAHRTLLEAQRGVLVHSRWAASLVREEGVEVPVAVVPMPMPTPEPADDSGDRARALRARLGIPVQALLLGSFGFQTPIKRTTTVIRAMAREGLDGCHLLVVGEASPAVDLRAVALECGVGERVHEVGFLSEDDFQTAIEACDLCVNLRYPTAGETSASLLRTFARGRAAVVSDYAQFADLSDELVLKVPVDEPLREAEALAETLRPLIADRDAVARMGARARRLVEREHSPERAARAMLEAILGFTADPRDERAPSPRACDPPPTSRTWGELPAATFVRGHENWPGGARRLLEIEVCNRGFATWLPAEAGPGGVALRIQLLQDGRDLYAGEPWLPLSRAVRSGESARFRARVRRPWGPARLRVEAQVLGGESFTALGGGAWEEAI